MVSYSPNPHQPFLIILQTSLFFLVLTSLYIFLHNQALYLIFYLLSQLQMKFLLHTYIRKNNYKNVVFLPIHILFCHQLLHFLQNIFYSFSRIDCNGFRPVNFFKSPAHYGKNSRNCNLPAPGQKKYFSGRIVHYRRLV